MTSGQSTSANQNGSFGSNVGSFQWRQSASANPHWLNGSRSPFSDVSQTKPIKKDHLDNEDFDAGAIRREDSHTQYAGQHLSIFFLPE